MDAYKNVTECLDEWGTDCSEKIRKSPLQAVLLAGGVGYILRFIPVFSLFAVIIRLVLALVKPALLVFGVVQIAKCLGVKCCSSDKEEASEGDLEFPRSLDSK